MVERVDVAVVGGGAMGLAAAWRLAPRAGVVVLERFEPRHTRGASHGDERMFRALYPDPVYAQLAAAAEDGWQELEQESGRTLFHRIGSILHGTGADLDATVDAADAAGVKVERLTADAAAQRWPGMRFDGDVVVQPAGGWLQAAHTLQGMAMLATRAGADVRFGTQVLAVDAESAPDDGVWLHVGDGHGRVDAILAEVVVVTGGAWTGPLLPGVELPPMTTTEEHVFFFEPRDPAALAAAAPAITTFLHEQDVDADVYGLPGPNGMVKVGEHHTGTVTTADDRTFAVDPEPIDRIERYVTEWVPGLVPEVLSTTTCLYTSPPTRDFVLDRVGRVVIGAGFSGHGFKFVPEIGRRLADMATGDAEPDPRFTLAWHAAR